MLCAKNFMHSSDTVASILKQVHHIHIIRFWWCTNSQLLNELLGVLIHLIQMTFDNIKSIKSGLYCP